jgi:transposase InsO family protein
VLAALREVIAKQGIFCALYSDRGSHFWLTPKAGEAVDSHRLTQVGRALRELGIRMIPAYSPQARGRSERNFGTWQGRLPQELRLAGCSTLDQANGFLRERYIAEFNRRFQVPAAEAGSAFVPCAGRDLERVFSLQFERTVSRDNTVSFLNRMLQIQPARGRGTLAGCSVNVHQHLDGTLSLYYGPHCLGRYDASGAPLKTSASTKLSRGRGAAPFPCNPIPKTHPTQTVRAQL